jgi:hypothetical protein
MTRSTFLSSSSVAPQIHAAAISLNLVSRIVSLFGVLLFVTSIYLSSFDIPSYNINSTSLTSNKWEDSSAIMEGSNGATTQQGYEVDLASFLGTHKKDFMNELRSDSRLDGWVIVMGEL